MVFANDTFFIVGNAKTTSDNPITQTYSIFFVTFVVEPENGIILDAEASVMLELSKEFIRSLFVGGSLFREDTDLITDIQKRYHGSSKKALIVAYKDAVKKFRNAVQAR